MWIPHPEVRNYFIQKRRRHDSPGGRVDYWGSKAKPTRPTILDIPMFCEAAKEKSVKLRDWSDRTEGKKFVLHAADPRFNPYYPIWSHEPTRSDFGAHTRSNL